MSAEGQTEAEDNVSISPLITYERASERATYSIAIRLNREH